MTQTMISSYGRNMNGWIQKMCYCSTLIPKCVYIYATKLEQDVEFTQLELNQ